VAWVYDLDLSGRLGEAAVVGRVLLALVNGSKDASSVTGSVVRPGEEQVTCGSETGASSARSKSAEQSKIMTTRYTTYMTLRAGAPRIARQLTAVHAASADPRRIASRFVAGGDRPVLSAAATRSEVDPGRAEGLDTDGFSELRPS
jgi:hypothetical protein